MGKSAPRGTRGSPPAEAGAGSPKGNTGREPAGCGRAAAGQGASRAERPPPHPRRRMRRGNIPGLLVASPGCRERRRSEPAPARGFATSSGARQTGPDAQLEILLARIGQIEEERLASSLVRLRCHASAASPASGLPQSPHARRLRQAAARHSGPPPLAMTDRDELNAFSSQGPDHTDERRHFYVCKRCGQAVDKRNLGDVFHHEEPGHERLPEN